MSVEPPLFPDEPDRATLRTTRVRVPRGVLQGSVATALPCDNFYDVFPEEIGPLGNVVVTDAAELQQWLLVARRVSRADAESQGGCIQRSEERRVGKEWRSRWLTDPYKKKRPNTT